MSKFNSFYWCFEKSFKISKVETKVMAIWGHCDPVATSEVKTVSSNIFGKHLARLMSIPIHARFILHKKAQYVCSQFKNYPNKKWSIAIYHSSTIWFSIFDHMKKGVAHWVVTTLQVKWEVTMGFKKLGGRWLHNKWVQWTAIEKSQWH